jgi:hypothetical protein
VWIIAPDGRHLGTLRCPQLPANMAWGDSGRVILGGNFAGTRIHFGNDAQAA